MVITKIMRSAAYTVAAAAFALTVAVVPATAVYATKNENKSQGKSLAKGHDKKEQNAPAFETPASEKANENAQKDEGVVSDTAASTTQSNVQAQANTKTAPKGNNGTLKVHEKGTPRATENNDPKVCVFNFEGFGFDLGQSGYIEITGQGQSKGKKYGPFDFGPTVKADKHVSFAETEYFNDGGVRVANGHYKATLYGKQTGGSVDYKDVKAKSKVFKVTCETAPVTPEDEKPEGEVLGDTTGKGTVLPSVLPSTGANTAFFVAVAVAIAGFVGLISYAAKSAYLKLA